MTFKFFCLIEIWITWSQKELAKPQAQIFDPQIYILESEITDLRDYLCSYYLEIWISYTTEIS